jgi:hypothetical protein
MDPLLDSFYSNCHSLIKVLIGMLQIATIQTFSKLFDINEIQTAFSKRRELDYRCIGS